MGSPMDSRGSALVQQGAVGAAPVPAPPAGWQRDGAGQSPSEAEARPEGGPRGRLHRSALIGERAHDAVILLAPDLTVASATPAVGFLRLAIYLAVNRRPFRFCKFDHPTFRLGGATNHQILRIP